MIEGKVKRGRPKKTWEETVKDDMMEERFEDRGCHRQRLTLIFRDEDQASTTGEWKMMMLENLLIQAGVSPIPVIRSTGDFLSAESVLSIASNTITVFDLTGACSKSVTPGSKQPIEMSQLRENRLGTQVNKGVSGGYDFVD
ncbi:unnamed protein product [Clavelina lepadiformis]|uniref:Uncharacterized protein n=1 Tax=Clavelina lepadiformis TaxID=159417 RepID=A0ABP0FQM8_CLALP